MGMFRRNRGTTFSDFDPRSPLDPGKPDEAIAALRAAVRAYKNERFNYYAGQMSGRTDVVNGSPRIVAGLGVAGIVLTSAAVVVRALSLPDVAILRWTGGDLVLLALAAGAYTVMAALQLYARLTEAPGGYFRAAATIVAIRDLWTEYQFAEIARGLVPADSDGAREIERWRAPIQEFCEKLDAIVAKELTDWQAAYAATAQLRTETAEKGLQAALTELKTSAEAAATAARAAADAAAAGRLPASLNLTLGTATTAGKMVVKIDGTKAGEGNGQRSFALAGLTQGEHVIRVEFTPAAAGGTMTPYEKAVLLRGGINDVSIPVP